MMGLNGQRTGREESVDGERNGRDGWEGTRQGPDEEAPQRNSKSRSGGALEGKGHVYFIETEDAGFVRISNSQDADLFESAKRLARR